MPRKFTGQEIVEIAVRIEKNGEKLYRTLAEQTEFRTVQEVFIALANEEKEHVVSFDKIREEIGSFNPEEAYPGEYTLYLEALINENVFARKEIFQDLAKKVVTALEALDLAVWFEKETLIFLMEIRDSLVRNDLPVLNELVRQEQEHIKKLSEIKKTIAREK